MEKLNNRDVTLNKRDVAILIATYNRAEEIAETLRFLVEKDNIPGKIFIIDQTKDDSTKKVVIGFKKKLPVEFVHSPVPSSSIAKNIGIKLARDKYKLILILDDDVNLYEGYIDEALKVFNSHPEVMAIGGVDSGAFQQNRERAGKKKTGGAGNLFLRAFFLPNYKKNSYKITGPYGYNVDSCPQKLIKDAEWLPGFNEFLRSEVFDDYLIPESIGGNVLEDLDSSYHTFRRYGKGSVIITPKCRADHRASTGARHNEKKRIFINHDDHFYFYNQYFKNLFGTIQLGWSLTGFIAGLFLKYLAKPNKNNLNILKWNIEAVGYCLKNNSNISGGKLRGFLNKNF